MFVLHWAKHWNYRDQDNRMTSRVSDEGQIRAETVEEVRAQARAMVIRDCATREMTRAKVRGMDNQPFHQGDYYDYHFDDTILEVVDEIPFAENAITMSPEYAKALAALNAAGDAADQRREERRLQRKREKLAALKSFRLEKSSSMTSFAVRS